LVFYTSAGEKIGVQKIMINTGSNRIHIDATRDKTRSVNLVSLFMDDRIVFTGKLLK
jgi:hypothetical protein